MQIQPRPRPPLALPSSLQACTATHLPGSSDVGGLEPGGSALGATLVPTWAVCDCCKHMQGVGQGVVVGILIVGYKPHLHECKMRMSWGALLLTEVAVQKAQ